MIKNKILIGICIFTYLLNIIRCTKCKKENIKVSLLHKLIEI